MENLSQRMEVKNFPHQLSQLKDTTVAKKARTSGTKQNIGTRKISKLKHNNQSDYECGSHNSQDKKQGDLS